MANVRSVQITLTQMKQDLSVYQTNVKQIKFLTSKGSVKIAKNTLTQIKNKDYASQKLVMRLKI